MYSKERKMKKLILVPFLIALLTTSFTFAKDAEKIGILVLTHGSKEKSWSETVENATKEIKERFPVAIVFGKANPVTMQKGIDTLENQGINKIVVVQLFISSYSPIIRQNEYLLGLRKELADPPISMMHNESGDTEKGNNHQKKINLKQLQINAKIVLTKPLDAHLFVTHTLFNRMTDLSKDPSNETVIIVAHGPNGREDNKSLIAMMDKLSDQIKKLQVANGENYKQIFTTTVGDDANPETYEKTKQYLRKLVSQAGKDGEVIVIPLLLSNAGIEEVFVKRLEGLDYKWSGKTVLPDSIIAKFIEESVNSKVVKITPFNSTR